MKTLIAFVILSATASISAFANQDPAGYTKAYDCGVKGVTVVSKGPKLFIKDEREDEPDYYPLVLKGRHVNMGSNRYDSEIAVFEVSSGMTVSWQLMLKEDREVHTCGPSTAL